MQLRLASHLEYVLALGCYKSPNENRYPRNGHDDALDHEKPPQVVRMHVKKRHLDQPEKEERNHGVCRDTLVLGNGVLEGQEGRPDGPEHDAHRVGAVHGLDGEPEYGEDSTRDDGNV